MLRTMRPLLVICALLPLTWPAGSRAALPEVQLLRPDSLVGWDHAGVPPSGWTIADGRLTAAASSTPLVSGWTFGDFELCLCWSGDDGGQCKLSFPKVPAGQGLEILLAEGPECGRLTAGDTLLAPGAKVGPLGNRKRMHTASIRRTGEKLSFTADGRWLYEVDIPVDCRYGLALAAAGKVTLCNLRLREPAGEPMFRDNGFDGWWTPGDITKWRFEKGQVVRFDRAGDYLRTRKQFANFTWSFEYKMQRRGNSGLGIRTPREGWPTADGMELQLLDTPYNAEIKDQPCMAVYGHVLPLGRADKSQQWNRVVVKADGWMLSAWMNGELVQQVNTFHHPELKHRHLRGWLGFQDHGAWIRLRNVHLFEAPAGLGLAAWYQPKPPLGVTAILDRLINPERLSILDGISTGVAQKSFSVKPPKEVVKPPKEEVKKPKEDVNKAKDNVKPPKEEAKKPKEDVNKAKDNVKPPKEEAKPTDAAKKKPPIVQKKPVEHVLADLRGPGAVVRIARIAGDGQLAFYFDGEKQPRIECAADEIHAVLPRVGKDANPILTCLTYLRRLKIVAAGATEGNYRVDYVTLPGELPVETFRDPESGFPRGWLPAASTLLRWIGGGRFHEYDRLARHQSEPKTLEPGQRVVMVDVGEAGIVKLWKVLAPARVLENNDLWLHVTIDGEKRPALSAPVRYLFPALRGNYDNYLLANQEGPTCFLPMPFAGGITVALENRGGRPLENLGVLLAIKPANRTTRESVAGRLRLRGLFQPAGSNNGQLIRQKGAGRWVGFVYQAPEGPAAGISSVLVDGRPTTGWSAPTLDPFLGDVGEFRKHLCGRQGVLAWRYLLLAPVEFQESLLVTSDGKKVGERLALFYLEK